MAPSLDYCASLLCCEDVSGYLSGDREGVHVSCESSLPWLVVELEDKAAIAALTEREVLYLPQPDYAIKYQSQLLDAGARQQAISWLFKVRAYHNFAPLTAALSANYLDRFLSCHRLPTSKAWTIQLLSVACLSLAVKMEEVEVPLLLDLQVGTECIFEPRTIQRMELLVLTTLEWRLSCVTPFSYIEYFVSKFDFEGSSHTMILARINELLLLAVQEIRFLCFRPASIAVAAVLCAIQEILPLQVAKFKKILLSMLQSQLQDPSERCLTLMWELFVVLRCTSSKDFFCKFSVTRSPMGVSDISFSCDSESTFKSTESDPSCQISSPPTKKWKVEYFCSSMKACAS